MLSPSGTVASVLNALEQHADSGGPACCEKSLLKKSCICRGPLCRISVRWGGWNVAGLEANCLIMD